MKSTEREERSVVPAGTRATCEGWTTAHDLRAQLRRRWDRGEFLRSMTSDELLFPLRLVLKGPSSRELAEAFEEVRAWIAELVAVSGIHVEWREFTHRILGSQRVPASAWVDSLRDALAIIGKQREAAVFGDILALTRARRPELLSWIEKRPLQALALVDDLERLLAVVDWCVRHPSSLSD